MHHALSFAIAILLVVGALAAPLPSKTLNKRTFKFQAPPRIGVARNPLNSMILAYKKYGWQIIVVNPQDPWASIFGGNPSESSQGDTSSSVAPAPAAKSSSPSSANLGGSNDAASKTAVSAPASTAKPAAASANDASTGEVTASPQPDESEYLSPVSIGGQQLNLDFDTGSADFWVFSSSLPSSESNGHTTFDPSKSSTWTDYQGGSWQISYGDGSSASGTVGFDRVAVGGATATKQAVELATAVSGSFIQDVNNDGLVGLGFSKVNTVQPQQQKTFFENIMSDLAQPVFTANLEEDASGTYTFGEIDRSQYSGDIHFTPIDNSNGFWEFGSNTYSIGGTSSKCSTCSPAIADTGTSLVLMDDDIVTAYYSQVSGAQMSSLHGGYVYPCSAELPSFGLAIGSDYTATLQGSEITFADVGDNTCFGGIQSNGGGGLQIVGDVLLKQYFAVFDGGNNSFGIANKA